MRNLIIPIFILAVAGLVFSVSQLMRMSGRQQQAKAPPIVQPDAASLGLSVPEFKLVDQDGREATQAIFDGKVTVLDFFFTHCPFICPTMTLTMQDLAKDLADTPVQFVSVSVDPAHDTPPVIRKYATDKEIDLTRWMFLTGEYATIEKIARGSLQFEIGADNDPRKKISLPDGGSMQNVTHPSKLILVGPDRKVLGFYEYSDAEAVKMLEYRARAAVKGAR